MVLKSLTILAIVLGFGAMVSAEEIITMRNQQIVTKSFVGFGAEWDAHAYTASGVNTEDFALITSRIKNMKLPVVRIMMLGAYCYVGNNQYNWDSEKMKLLYRHLDFCQKEGIKVILCAWGAGTTDTSWYKIPGISGVDDPAYADVVGSYMDHLITTKGYTCIKYFSNCNEPDLSLSNNWSPWRSSTVAIAANFAKRGLNKKIQFVGPETSQEYADSWLANSAYQLSDVLGVSAMHYYAKKDYIKSGNVEGYLQQKKNRGPAKPFFISEAGIKDDVSKNVNPHIGDFDYGISMADYAVQALRGGAASVSAWMLDDNSHEGFVWGMWSSKASGMTIRPWYTVWSLLSQFFTASSTIYRIDQPSSVRVVAARAPSKLNSHSLDYSFCFVNRDTVTHNIKLNVASAKPETKSFTRYVYDQGPGIKDSYFPFLSQDKKSYNLANAIVVACPPNSVVVLTSM